MTKAVVLNWTAGLAIVALAAGYMVLSERSRRHWENPLRNEMRARPATFRAWTPMQAYRGPVRLSVHGDMFEVADKFPVIGYLNGKDYCYRAPDTTVEMAYEGRRDWIEIHGLPGTGAEPIRIGSRNVNRQLWDVLVSAGAHPIGPPPPP
jgi:hypothetical protein